MVALAHLAAKKHWATATFLYYVRKTDWYKAYFHGKPETMSEGEYNNMVLNYQRLGNQIGEHIDRSQAAYLIENNISTTEFRDRVSAIQKIDNNKQTMDAFVKTLKARGIIPRTATVKDADLYRFVMRRGPDEWYKVWDEAQVRMAAAEAGYEIGHNITRQQVIGLAHQLQGSGPGGMSIEEIEKGFQDLATATRALLPQARAVGVHISRKELQQLAFGGPLRAQAQAKALSIQAQFKSATAGATAVPQLVQTQEGARLLGGFEGLSTKGTSQ